MDRDSVSGYVSPTQFVNEGKVEVLNTSGTVIAIDLREIKGVYFVREFGEAESAHPQDVHLPPTLRGIVGAPALQRQRSARRPDAGRPDCTAYAGRISGESSRPAVEHAAHLRAAHRVGIADRAGRDRGDASRQRRARRISARSRCSKSRVCVGTDAFVRPASVASVCSPYFFACVEMKERKTFTVFFHCSARNPQPDVTSALARRNQKSRSSPKRKPWSADTANPARARILNPKPLRLKILPVSCSDPKIYFDISR